MKRTTKFLTGAAAMAALVGVATQVQAGGFVYWGTAYRPAVVPAPLVAAPVVVPAPVVAAPVVVPAPVVAAPVYTPSPYYYYNYTPTAYYYPAYYSACYPAYYSACYPAYYPAYYPVRPFGFSFGLGFVFGGRHHHH
jgi:hypothetical protein